jgi:two-component system osmolarity sensor histidine kinase EnvZ
MRLALEMFDRHPGPVWIERLERDIEEMTRLVGDVLELARGLGQEAAVPVDVAGLLRELAEPARAEGSQIEVQCPDLLLNTAPASLRRVLGNLLDNALRYGGDGPVQLRVEAVGGGWRIGVLDRGPGIPADQMEAVFRPFHRVETSRSPTTGGSGLGLAIVRQLAQANGLQVWLENRPDGGLAAWVGLSAAG